MPVLPPIDIPDDLDACQRLIREMARDIEQYRHRIDVLLRQRYGSRSEKFDASHPDFLAELLGAMQEAVAEPPADAAPVEEPVEEPPASKPPRSGKRGLKSLPPDLPRQKVTHDVSPEEKICSQCGAQKTRIGEDVTEQLDYVPASLLVIQHICPKYACPKCHDGVVQGEKPPQPIEKGLPGPGLLAHVLISKYSDHLPLNRQEDILARHGVELSRSTLCDWAMAAAETLEPVVQRMREEVLKSFAIHTDDTSVRVRHGRKMRKNYLWTYLGDNAHPYIVYDFTESRSRAGPEAFLGDYEGYLQADAYSGYDHLYATRPILEVACMAHARRKFFEAKETDPVHAHEALLRIGDLYAIEREAKDLEPEARRALRLKRSAPILNEFHRWLRRTAETLLPKSPIAQAVAYALGNWAALCRYLGDGRLSIDNNAAERALRAVVVGRNNWQFCGSPRGGRAAATLYSIIQSAKRHALDPFAYMRDLLARIPILSHKRIAELLPDKWMPAPAPAPAED